MTIIALQCRLASTRLPNKALLMLENKEIFRCALITLKKITVDEYWVACDEDSYPILSKIAREEGWNCFAGPRDDVLERYCLLAKQTGADTILRATADNPFLFYEAGRESLLEFTKNGCDYFAFSGLPHGSGIEVFSAHAIQKAKTITQDAYDHEHVGPALYNHQDVFNVIFKTAPLQWTHENDAISYRTTVDTISDYRRAIRISEYLKAGGYTYPYASSEIFAALDSQEVQKPLLFVPAVKTGCGTGHIRRVLTLIKDLRKYGILSDILLTTSPSFDVNEELQKALQANVLQNHNLITQVPTEREYFLVIFDAFKSSNDFLEKMFSLAPVIALDEGCLQRNNIDYILNILPSLDVSDTINSFNPSLLDLPQHPKRTVSSIKKVLVSIGGEDPAGFSKRIYDILQEVFLDTGIRVDCTLLNPIPNLRENIQAYDLVITHFGFTAFEAINAGCKIITVATSPIHKKLSKKYNLECIEKKDCTITTFKRLFERIETLTSKKLEALLCNISNQSLAEKIYSFYNAKKYDCPICGEKNIVDHVVARDTIKTIRKCSTCSMLYVSFCIQEEKEYSKDYFFDEYKKQYGKTYLEDFDMIKLSGFLRMERIRRILKYSYKNVEDTVLDIGCAYGPFLEAVKMISFKPYGTDISKDAVDYVVNTLSHTAAVASFPNISVKESFGKFAPKNGKFRVVTMWYVIEHFQNLDEVLKKVNSLLVPGGVFAFSTPNALGISRRVNQKKFFAQSPYDHCSIWDYKTAKKILKRYGFTVRHFESTGIHWQRYPKILQKLHLTVIIKLAEIFKLGDTFEVYCVKVKDV